jgi:hypothetical protein
VANLLDPAGSDAFRSLRSSVRPARSKTSGPANQSAGSFDDPDAFTASTAQMSRASKGAMQSRLAILGQTVWPPID